MHATPAIPKYCWTRHFNESEPEQGTSSGYKLRQFFEYLPVIWRMLHYERQLRKEGYPSTINVFRPEVAGTNRGVPLGGLGGGSINRSWRGDFYGWQLQPGIIHYSPVFADQFSLWSQRPGETSQSVVLNPRQPGGNFLTAWSWNLNPETGTYHALFPRAWTVYENPLPGLRLTCRQISPVIPHNYKESSYPVTVFSWTVENTAETPLTASIMFTFQNGTGKDNDLAGGHTNQIFEQGSPDSEILGIALRHIHRQPRPIHAKLAKNEQVNFEDPLTFVIASQRKPGIELTYHGRFITNSSGHDIWDDFALDGKLVNYSNEKTSQPGLSIGAALAARFEVPAGGCQEINFALAWDMPLARFGWGTAWYRRYTRFFGTDGNAAPHLAQVALTDFPLWEEQISAWQEPILQNNELPDWYKSALFNETYYLVDGGTIWTAGKVENQLDQYDLLPEPEIGHFAYLEGFDYRMYNTSDVHFYASFALAMLWPKLELSLQQDYINSLDVEHPEKHTMWLTGKRAPRKVRQIIPHDVGSPAADPWRKLNAYLAQDVSRWKDLNSKFVLMLFRDMVITHDMSFLKLAYPAAVKAIEYLSLFDKDNDGLIENEGYPDQTYDTWSASGPSAYTGGLWLGALSALSVMAEELGFTSEAEDYRCRLSHGQSVYEEKLWNGEYYNYDASKSKYHNSIMADQLAGHWYARACGLAGIVPIDHAQSALHKIFNYNVMQFQNGERGAINGMLPDGKLDRNNLQSTEIWIGTCYALAAAMIQEGMRSEAFATAHAIYKTIYSDMGLWFQTPEAINIMGTYRSPGYMRPLAIWAIQWALERQN